MYSTQNLNLRLKRIMDCGYYSLQAVDLHQLELQLLCSQRYIARITMQEERAGGCADH